MCLLLDVECARVLYGQKIVPRTTCAFQDDFIWFWLLTFTSYVQGGIGEDGKTFGETYILSIPSFQWTLVPTSPSDHP
jgi:hypothetical protein